MKIGIDARTLQDRYYSGIPAYSYNLIKAMLELDQANEYCLFYNYFKDLSLPDMSPARICRRRYPNKIFNYCLQKSFRWPKLDQITGAEIVFLPHFNFAAVSKQAKVVLTVHDLSFLKFPHFFSARKNLWHWAVNARKLINRANVIVAVSESTKKDIIDLTGTKPDKIKVIYSGLSPEFSVLEKNNPKLAQVKTKYNLPANFIFSLGTLEPRKNISGLIAAFEAIKRDPALDPNLKLVIAGGRGWKSQPIFKAARTSPCSRDIIFLDYVADEDKTALYNSAAVFVNPSFYEGFGFPLLEAMACGCPAIAGNVSSLPETAGSAAILVDPFNQAEIAQAIEKVLTDDILRRQLIKRGLANARGFDWRTAARAYLDLFILNCSSNFDL